MLDLSRLLPGPYCSLLLADLGMEVLKVEDLEQGDYMRKMGPIRIKIRTQKEWVEFFKNADACCEPVLTLEEVFHHPQVLHRGMIKESEHRIEGKIWQLGNPIKSSQFPFEIRTPSPTWGKNTMEVLKAIGYPEEEIQRFKEIKAI